MDYGDLLIIAGVAVVFVFLWMATSKKRDLEWAKKSPSQRNNGTAVALAVVMMLGSFLVAIIAFSQTSRWVQKRKTLATTSFTL